MPNANTSPFYDMDMNEATALYVLSLYEAGIIKGSEDKSSRWSGRRLWLFPNTRWPSGNLWERFRCIRPLS